MIDDPFELLTAPGKRDPDAQDAAPGAPERAEEGDATQVALELDGPGLDLTAALAEALVAVDARPAPRPAAAFPEPALAAPAEPAPVIRGAVPSGPNVRSSVDLYAIQRTADALQIALDRSLEETAQARADLSAARRRFLKLSDDHEALRTSAVRNEGEVRAAGMRRALEAILPALDALDAMIDHLEKRETLSPTGQEGVQMLRLEWQRTLQTLGVQPFESEGKVFDPAVHEAIANQVDAGNPPGRVLRQLSRGYWLGAKLLRSARVVVSKAPPEAQPHETKEKPED